ncbi:hypothetical protein TB147_17820 [Klebsiella aerogenes]|uniref:hypothetical protein n=1 Tax=Klebsiella aerogenes TaxID=548 RepID=UPI002E32F499|nr:hypothetical protein [Klebsiella aerogenes]MED7793163.1 hypothetical protein [Klebsiella aerogenes]
MLFGKIDEPIQPLVMTLNACGFHTFASCSGHGFPVHRLLPYVAFRAPLFRVAALDRSLYHDSLSAIPVLNWGWFLTGSFNPNGELGFCLRPTRPYRRVDIYRRGSLQADFEVLGILLHGLARQEPLNTSV